ncbi:putative toxin-antitoxin system toxin component, PIN family [Dyadobacter fanqingshengii]|uniref:Toxin-antitoxin system toxin component, PIN family n=1 Tax=Dyadobacter fanqingshengii TaxID=2906443 RepID=A0A9X1P963_9BACT|nr:putative toxin-antitoxin system toxin component, PIN family [Dyadobacter fanqingshengii]MCF0038997.1 putative toxin-antitoxin system toxin component, PIN family [Dyadobacter fanqingshengii]USJ34181.1 putative toxin-antitoxin system toxin component, PIN family [Dyadobacter fanqingshengii]
MRNNSKKIILDTNLWISFLTSKDFSKLDKIHFSRKCRLVFSEELMQEFLQVAGRPKFKKYFSSDDLEAILESIEEFADFVHVTTVTTLCRDPKDNFLLSLAIDSKANYLLTGDTDLLDIKKITNTEILTISQFLQKI